MATFRIVPDRSRVWIDARTSVHPIHGEADGVTGALDLEVDGDALVLEPPPTGRLTLPVGRLRSGNRLYDSELLRRVDARRYPEIIAEVREVTRSGHGYRVRGDLTFHGVTRRVDGEVSVAFPDPDTAEITGERTFDVRDFGVEPPKILLLRVYPDVTVRVRLLAARADD
ncbi:YceI family protein [Longispora sp. K20-0274]|uniref:YceI family protein n=1 Tax=Longispora sp. K20-0274 TaxID=3088255 RepID=UPI00399C20AF